MSTTLQAEASKPQKKMQECNRCKSGWISKPADSLREGRRGFGDRQSQVEAVDEYGNEHVHKGGTQLAIYCLLGVSEL